MEKLHADAVQMKDVPFLTVVQQREDPIADEKANERVPNAENSGNPYQVGTENQSLT
jgi:hypothetical protein